jgi:predicted dehydrogenase
MGTMNQTTRRRFLKTSAAVAAGAVGFPTFVPSHVLAAPGRQGANDRIGIGIIGPGRQGAGDLRQAAKFGQVMATADVYLPRAGQVASEYGAKAFQDYRKLLDMKEIDAVLVTTPDHWRTLICIHACQAGKDIYAEKCLTLTIAEGRKLVEAVRKYGRVFQTGSQQRSMPENRDGCALVRGGAIGKVQTIIGHNYPSPWECNMPGKPLLEGLDWDAWCGPVEPIPFHNDIFAPRANPGWLSFRPFSGGEMTGWGAHGLDQIQWALGMDESGPVEVWVEGPKFNPPTYTSNGPREAGDAQCRRPMIFYRYANGVVVKLDNGPNGGGVFIGDKGSITINRASVTSKPPELTRGKIGHDEKKRDGVEMHMENWFECMRTRQRCAADVEIGHRSSTVCHLGNIARWLNRKLKWDPVKEVFVGDDEANAFLDRKRRKGYELPEKV